MTPRSDEARLLDSAIDALLGLGPERDEGEPEAELAATARLLAELMPRFHPRFAFEERLARRLSTGRAAVASAGASDATPPGSIRTPGVEAFAGGGGPRRPWLDPRALLRGSALALGVALASGVSIALPIAGAALVRRRRARAASRAGGVV
ncbi:hypothetical protein BH24CHL9_BH24CHL9_00360 [soil metagenome]